MNKQESIETNTHPSGGIPRGREAMIPASYLDDHCDMCGQHFIQDEQGEVVGGYKEVPTLIEKKRERDILYWKLEQLDREIYAFENYDPRDVG